MNRLLPPARALALLLLASPAWSITWSTIRSDCRALVKDTSTSRTRFSNAQLLRFGNEGQKEAISYGKIIRKSYEFELVSGTTYYSMPSDFLMAVRLSRDYLVLEEKSVANLDKSQQWEKTKGLPINYFVNFSSRTKIGFYPFPDSSTSTGTIRMEYAATATDLSADGDSVFNGIQELQPYGYSLAFYCAYRASLLDGQLPQAQAYLAEWRKNLEMMTVDSFRRPNYNPSMTPASTPGGGGGGWPPGQ